MAARSSPLSNSGRCFLCHFLRSVFLTALLLILSACSTNYAPVEQRSIKPYKSRDYYSTSKRTPEYYRVKKGDSLYSIAWNYGLDYKSLARWNHITYPYTIYAGKTIHLKPGKTTYHSAGASKNYIKQGKIQKNKSNSAKTGTNLKKSQSNKINTTTKQTKSSSGSRQTSKKTKNGATTASTTQYKKPSTDSTRLYSSNTQLQWAWPVKGKILQSYAPAKGKKGIDIAAGEGTLIRAAEKGKVVYSGQGLRGYGLLLIIKHNETFLSAYAHNQSLLVKEGQIVEKGQVIAKLGNTGTDRYKLHFEIRKSGQPVNPISYLP